MTEHILSIEEIEEGSGFDGLSGYAITTSKQVIKFLVESFQLCCEEWGYMTTNDNTNDFVGAKVLAIKRVAADYSKLPIVPDDDEFINTIFVDIETNIGVLQFAAYNAHNGYYGHEVKIVSEQLTISEEL